MSDRLNPGDSLAMGGLITSTDGRFTLTLQADGNLVLYQTGGAPRWASDTVGRTVSQAVMQADGNFVLYGPAEPIWATATEGHPGSYLAVQNDGNVVIYGPSGALWSAIDVKYLRLHIIPLTNTERDVNGNPTKPFAITPEQFASLVLRVNWSFDGTGIQLVFDPATDWQPMADTQLNTDAAGMRERGNQIAASILGKIVCFLRWGPRPQPTGNGNAYPPPGAGPKPPSVNDDIVQNYIALPNRIADNFGLLNQGNGSFVAHEVGHYLGLYHTFPGWDGHDPIFQRYKNPDGTNALPPSLTAADQAVVDYIAANGGTINALDGDLLSDTPPDPTTLLYQVHNQAICAQRQILVSGTMNGQPVSFTFAPDPNNAMSYYQACGPATAPPPPASFSPQQVQRMLQTLRHPSRRHLLTPVWSPWFQIHPETVFDHTTQKIAAVSRAPGNLDLFVIGFDNVIWTTFWNDSVGWNPGGWFQIHPETVFDHTTQKIAAVSRAPGNLDLFVIGFDNAVWSTFLNDQVGWNPGGWFQIHPETVFDHTTQKIAAVSRAPGNLDLFVIGFDNVIWTTFWNDSVGWNPGGWFQIHPETVFDHTTQQIAAVSRAPGNLDLFVIGFDNVIWTTFWNDSVGWNPGGWFQIHPETVFDHTTQQIAAVSRAPGNLDLFVIGFDNVIWSTFWNDSVGWNPGGWFQIHPETVFDHTTQQIATVSRAPGNLDLFVIGFDNVIWSTFWNDSVGWNPGGWFQIHPETVFDHTTQQIAAVSRAPGNLDLFVIGFDNAVWSTWWTA